MMQRYCKLRHHLPDIDHPKVQELFLSKEKDSDTDALLNRLTDPISVTLELRYDYTTLVNCSVLSDGFLEKHPSMKEQWVTKQNWSGIIILRKLFGEFNAERSQS